MSDDYVMVPMKMPLKKRTCFRRIKKEGTDDEYELKITPSPGVYDKVGCSGCSLKNFCLQFNRLYEQQKENETRIEELESALEESKKKDESVNVKKEGDTRVYQKSLY